MKEQLKISYKNAIKEKNENVKFALQGVLGEIAAKEKEIHLKEKNERELTDTEIIQILQKEIALYKDPLSDYKKAKRQDLIDINQEKIKVLESFLPDMLSLEDAKRLAMAYIDEKNLDTSNRGIMNKELRALLNGKAEKEVITEAINSLITK